MKLSIPISLTAADSERRIISGRIVTWNEEGNTSAGRTMFKAGSITPKNVKLLLEHDRTRPIGRVIEMTETPQGIDAKFKIANTTAGSDALEEAQTQLRDGFSVGISVDAWDNKDGVLVVSAGKLDEVSLVAEPAINSARVSDVAASYDDEKKDDEEDSESIDSGKTEEKGDEVENTVTEQGLEATFKLAKTFAADDALEEAATGLRDGFSVGVKINEWKNEDGVLKIQSSSLQEVSLVTEPAISSARVAEVAASETPENSEATAEETTTQEDKVSDTTSEAPIATEAVEASQAPVVTAQYMAYTKPRVDTNVTAGQYAAAQIRAIQGDNDARDLLAALAIGTVSENTGMVPPNYLRGVIGVIDSSRPFIDRGGYNCRHHWQPVDPEWGTVKDDGTFKYTVE